MIGLFGGGGGRFRLTRNLGSSGEENVFCIQRVIKEVENRNTGVFTMLRPTTQASFSHLTKVPAHIMSGRKPNLPQKIPSFQPMHNKPFAYIPTLKGPL